MNVIELKGISKEYELGEYHGGGLVERAVARMRGRPVSGPKRHKALDGIDLEVKQGEILGIIGANGSGKSTLLKILARITEPTAGRGIIRGRVAPLLEVGTGFNPALTGRQNVHINGTLLGMTKAEIDKQFDGIVDFAGVEKYIDTPVKRYSSGMKVRLGFAVAAHLQPEILLVDEVLAVGDAEFQRKCLGKMGEVAAGGRTVLFVSHQLEMIANICGRVAWLVRGQVAASGAPSETVHAYLISNLSTGTELSAAEGRAGDGDIRIHSIKVQGERNLQPNVCFPSEIIVLDISWVSKNEVRFAVDFYAWIGTASFAKLCCLSNTSSGKSLKLVGSKGSVKCKFGPLNLVPGEYILSIFVTESGRLIDDIPDGIVMTVLSEDFYRSGRGPHPQSKILVSNQWEATE